MTGPARLLAALAAAAALAGCTHGSDADEEAGSPSVTSPPATAATTPAPVETRPEPAEDQSRWARQVDAACRPVQERIDAIPPPTDATGLERWLSEVLPLARRQLAAVKAVKPPAKESEAERAQLFVASLTDVERGLDRYLAAVRAGDTEAVADALAKTGAAGAAARSYAVSLGLTACGGYESG